MPPPNNTPSIVHKIRLLHKDLYIISHKLAKSDKLGIYQTIEAKNLDLLSSTISAAFKPRNLKISDLEDARIETEIVKNLVRTMHEISIIDDKTYFRLSEQLVEISKMVNGWITYLTQKES